MKADFSAWGFSGQAPTSIGYAMSALLSASTAEYSWTIAETVWGTPLIQVSSSPYMPPPHNTLITGGISYASLTRRAVYVYPIANPAGGALLGRDTSTYYFTVVRQGRFLQYGFSGIADRPWFAKATLWALPGRIRRSIL